MPARLFLFVQMELPWELGPADGRYLLRGPREGEPEQMVVLESRRATVIDPVPVASEGQAKAWLRGVDAERETLRAIGVLNRMLYAQPMEALALLHPEVEAACRTVQQGEEPDAKKIDHTLGRLEALLRARTAGGWEQ